MNTVKRTAALIMALIMAALCLPAGMSATEPERGTHSGVIIDTDPAGGYAGDYVVIYNPSESTGISYSTGSLAGLIDTTVYGGAEELPEETRGADADTLRRIDVDALMAEKAKDAQKQPAPQTRESFTVGEVRSFYIASYNPAGTGDLNFKLLYQGEHCNVWTVTVAAYHPLDAIDPDYARQAAVAFDSKYDLMRTSYGEHLTGSADGRVNLMYYNIDDGWEPGMGYVAGFFTQADYESYNYLPMIHIDTYPGVEYTNLAGEYKTHFEDTLTTIVHEYQHCINYSETDGDMNVWLNEALSGSAEELCYPGSGLYTRIQDWEDTRISVDELLYPPQEYKYNSSFDLHKGSSITAWNSYGDDIYARYGLVMLLMQYIRTRYGSSSVFKRIIAANTGSTVADSYTALKEGTGWTIDSLFGGFFTAMIANDRASGYGFEVGTGYDPADFHGVQDIMSLLSPVVYTSTSAASIYSGGFITIKPVNGVYDPPSGASSYLKYIGISFGSVGVQGIEVYPQNNVMLMNAELTLTLRKTPQDANDFTVTWTSSDLSVVTVEGNKNAAVVSSHSYGQATVTARATDNSTGAVYTSSATVKVRNGYSYVRYEPTDTIEVGVPYLIGYDTGDGVYVMMNYNPNAHNSYKPRYYESGGSYYCYGIGTSTDAEGNITGFDTGVYPDAQAVHAEWVFEQYSSGKYKIGSNYEPGYYLVIYAVSSGYYDLYANTTGPSTEWTYNANTRRLSYYVNNYMTKYASFAGDLDDGQDLFCAVTEPTDTANIRLYKKTSGTVIYDDDTYYTVTFRDWDGTVLKTQTVIEGGAATAPADPVREGYTFIGWDKSFTNITEDTVVTALYEQNAAQGLPGDVDCDGRVTFSDVSMLYLLLIGEDAQVSPQGMINADFNGDGVISFSDVSELYIFLTGRSL